MFGEVHESFVEAVIFAFHISVFHQNTKDMFVETSREVTLEQFIVIDGLSCNSII